MNRVSSSQNYSETVGEERGDKDISIWIRGWSLGTHLLNVSEVCSSLAVSYERKGYWVTGNPVYFVCAGESGMTPNPTQ